MSHPDSWIDRFGYRCALAPRWLLPFGYEWAYLQKSEEGNKSFRELETRFSVLEEERSILSKNYPIELS